MPADAELRTGPGTAITGRSRRCASVTVRSEPPASCDSTTTMSASAARSRFRAGNLHRSGGDAERCLAEQHAAPLDLAPQRAVAARVHDIEPRTHHRDRRGRVG